MSFKKDFPYFKFNKQDIYFDSAATSLKPKVVLDAENYYNTHIAANAHNNLFRNAFYANNLIDETRQLVANFIGAYDKNEIIFTSGATQSLNTVAFGLKDYLNNEDEIVLTDLEHSSNLLPWRVLEEKINFKIKYFDLNDDGSICIEKIQNCVTKNTKVVSFASVSNTVGAANNIKEIVKKIRSINKDVIVIIDAAQSIFHKLTNVKEWDIDFLAFSAHKMFGPFGLGILWGRMSWLEKINPLMYGGGNNSFIEYDKFRLAKIPHKFEAGTLNLSAISGLKAAICYINQIGLSKIQNYLIMLKNHFVKAVESLDKDKYIFYNLESDEPIILMNIKGINAQDVGDFFNKKYNILVRVGKHCARLSHHFLKVENTLRISLSIYNEKADLDTLILALNDIDNWMETVL
ncbi:cysteine desulfurase [Spiroplasma helicoides]|uniref:cysteine desulfurase n=1 Tax=Spiroplasma helicoides TaxID=216938 RepID=A0A1B3SL86_9MOLU|nr:aminotransferase class V-fold PLP-dependent enzyme [Spiroplasma helicoides]AOG60692.1 cysteine desulfurase [Spiroplasma helicoides]